MIKNENFISKDVTDKDLNLFFGPLNGETFIEIQPKWCMAHILHSVGIFKSITQARKNGWDKPIPEGWTEMRVGKFRRPLFILNIKE